jgi:WD40 repeat protein
VTRAPGDFGPALPAVSALGDRAAIAIGNNVVIYGLPGGQTLRTIRHPAAVTAVAFAKTGHDLVSGGVDGSLMLTRDDREDRALPAFPGGIDVVGLTPDGHVIAAGSTHQLRVYDPDRKTILADVDSLIRVRSVRLSSDGRRLITIPATGVPAAPVLWDLEHYRIIAQFEGHLGQVFSARFVRGDREILTAGNDGAARLWDAVTGRLRQTFFGSSQLLLDAALDPDGSTVVTAGGDGMLRFWDASSRRVIWTLHAHKSFISGIHFDGTDLVTHDFTGEISRWTLPKVPSSQDLVRRMGRIVRCLPFRLDEDTSGLVEQQRTCDPAVEGAPN